MTEVDYTIPSPLERTDPFADVFGLPYRQFPPWGLSRGYY